MGKTFSAIILAAACVGVGFARDADRVYDPWPRYFERLAAHCPEKQLRYLSPAALKDALETVFRQSLSAADRAELDRRMGRDPANGTIPACAPGSAACANFTFIETAEAMGRLDSLAVEVCSSPTVCRDPSCRTPVEATAKYSGRDFSALLVPQSEFIGFIGSDFRRLRMHFAAVTRDAHNPAVYHVRGETEVGENRDDFDGTITVTRIADDGPFAFDDEDGERIAGKARGRLTAAYELREAPRQAHAGVFAGTMTLDWYVDEEGLLRLDDIDIVSDGYANNQYIGRWASYAAPNAPKKANWGEYRIPDSHGLDCGAAEFAPCEEYYDKGWRDYAP